MQLKNTLLIICFTLIVFSLSSCLSHYSEQASWLTIDGYAKTVGENNTDRILNDGWTSYGGDQGGHRYSSLDQIHLSNVSDLEIAWQFQTGDLQTKPDAMRNAATEGTPIFVNDSLIFCTPFNEVIALHPGNGEVRWRFDAQTNLEQFPANQFVCRGVAYWQDQNNTMECPKRILMATNDSRLLAINADNGQLCKNFGLQGTLEIKPEIDLWWPGEFQFTSPPVIANNTVIIGSAIADNVRRAAPKGVVRAFDVVTGQAKWQFDPIPRTKDDNGHGSWLNDETPSEGHANVWAPMSIDVERNLVFLPTSSPSPDFYGGMRPGDNLHANSVVALNIDNGDIAWSFQTVHHDIWDYDLPAQPGLYSVWRGGRSHDVVAQVTKTGLVFVLDRDTGKPFLPIEERPVPQTAVTGEYLSPTQPFPVKTPPIVPSSITPNDAFGLSWFDQTACAKRIAQADANGLFTPPSARGTLVYPMNGGGANWGSAAYDPKRNLLLINMSNMAHEVKLIKKATEEIESKTMHDSTLAPQMGVPYALKRDLLLSPLGLPCNKPPWGVLAAVNLDSGNIVWRKPLGSIEELAPAGVDLDLGTPNLGGPVVTAGNLTFIAATMDSYIRAFETASGKELWQAKLPAAGQATPMTYEWEGIQYIAIYAGGNARSGSVLGDYIVAFSLSGSQ